MGNSGRRTDSLEMVLMADGKFSGIIIKCLGGLYTVESPDGIYESKARGVFRN